jgi:hypothetical protein
MKIINKDTGIVRQLRNQKLHSGHPFMINSKELKTNECYLEYPNGNIKLVSIKDDKQDFFVIRELTNIEANNLRERLKFSKI